MDVRRSTHQAHAQLAHDSANDAAFAFSEIVHTAFVQQIVACVARYRWALVRAMFTEAPMVPPLSYLCMKAEGQRRVRVL